MGGMTGDDTKWQMAETVCVFVCVFQAIMHHEGHMDDGLTLSRSQHEESRTARVIRSTVFLFNRFIRFHTPVHTCALLHTISVVNA